MPDSRFVQEEGRSDSACQISRSEMAAKEAWAKKRRSKPSLHIDLYNFEDSKYEGSKYVLTSPRSLDACSALGIKPMELLYRPLIDIQEELIPRDLPMSTIYSVYEETERERQNKLALTREERERIIAETANSSDEPVCDNTRKVTKRVTIKDVGSDSADSGTEVDHFEKNEGSLQRKRTARTTAIGHQRITEEELEKRANELHARALALREVTLALSKPKRMPKYKNAQKTGQKGASRKKVPRPFSASRVPVTGLRPGKRLR